MNTTVSIGFTYRGYQYHALIRPKVKDGNKEYHITVMNGTLENLIYGHHIVQEENGEIVFDHAQLSKETLELKIVIVEALRDYLAMSFRL